MLIVGKKHPIIDKVGEHIYLGDIVAVEDFDILENLNIKNVISLTEEKIKEKNEVTYFRFPIGDSRDSNIKHFFNQTNEIIKKSINDNENTLIHCQNAVSRSVSIVLAFYISEGINLKTGMETLKKRTSTFTRPNSGFSKQLLKYEKEILGYNSTTLQDIIS